MGGQGRKPVRESAEKESSGSDIWLASVDRLQHAFFLPQAGLIHYFLKDSTGSESNKTWTSM